MNKFDLRHYIVNRSITRHVMAKSKIGLPSVNITVHYAMTTSRLIDLQVFTEKLQDAERQIYKREIIGVTGKFRQLHIGL